MGAGVRGTIPVSPFHSPLHQFAEEFKGGALEGAVGGDGKGDEADALLLAGGVVLLYFLGSSGLRLFIGVLGNSPAVGEVGEGDAEVTSSIKSSVLFINRVVNRQHELPALNG